MCETCLLDERVALLAELAQDALGRRLARRRERLGGDRQRVDEALGVRLGHLGEDRVEGGGWGVIGGGLLEGGDWGVIGGWLEGGWGVIGG